MKILSGRKSSTMFGVVVVVVLSLLLAGCFTVDQEFHHEVNGSGKVIFDIGMSEEFLAMAGSDSVENPLGSVNAEELKAKDGNITNATVGEYSAGGYRHLKLTIEVKDFEKVFEGQNLLGESTDIRLEKLANGNYRFTQVITPNAQMGADFPGGDITTGMMKDSFWTVRYFAPKIVAADENGVIDRKMGMVEWKLPMTSLMSATQSTEMWVEYTVGASSDFPVWVIPVVIGALLCIGLVVLMAGVVLFLVLRKKKKPTEIVDPQV
jgi:hypothetical protein